MFGDFDIENYTKTGWVLFAVSSGLLPLVMLNLLIAIMSDTYSRVMGDIVPSDYYELNNLILEQECFQSCRKNSGSEKYLHFVEYLKKQNQKGEGI